jgi:hypothetical protein
LRLASFQARLLSAGDKEISSGIASIDHISAI